MLDRIRNFFRQWTRGESDTAHHTNYYKCAVNRCIRIGRPYTWGHATVVRLCWVHADKLGLTDGDLEK